MTSTLNNFYIYQLPVPRLIEGDLAFRPLAERAARLVGTTTEFDDLLKEVFGSQSTHQTHSVTDPAQRLTLRAEIDTLVASLDFRQKSSSRLEVVVVKAREQVDA